MLTIVNTHEMMSIVVAANPHHWWKIQCCQCHGAFRSTVTTICNDRKIMFHNFWWNLLCGSSTDGTHHK